MSGSPMNPLGDPALILGVAGGGVAAWVDGQVGLRGPEDLVVARIASLIEGVPHRNWHAEEPLARDQPVAVEPADPVLVAHPHVLRMPVELLATLDEAVTKLGVASTIGEVPLTSRDDLQRLIALLKELHRVHDLPRLTDEVACCTEHLDHPLLGGVARRADDGLVVAHADRVGDPFGDVGKDPAVPADDRTCRELKLAPPGDVGEVAEGADHGDARSLLGIGKVMRDDRDLDPERWRAHGRAEEGLVAGVVRVGDKRDACGEELGARGLDEDLLCRISRPREADPVVGAGALAVLELGLRDGGLEGDVPQGRCLGLIGLASVEIAQERKLAHALGVHSDRLIRLRPVNRQAHAPPEVLEDDLVLQGELLAELDEVLSGTGDLALGIGLGGWLEGGVVRQARVAANTVIVLDSPLSRQSVVVPAHRVEHLEPAHPLVAGDAVGMRVREHVADMQGAAHRRRGSVDREHGVARSGSVESIDALRFPGGGPPRLDTVEGGLVWHGIRGGHEASS